MRSNKERIFKLLINHSLVDESQGLTTQKIAEKLDMNRANASRLLNELVKEGKVVKSNGRPVLFRVKDIKLSSHLDPFADLIGSEGSLKNAITLAKAAINYPDQAINLFITGEVGVGKTNFAEKIYHYSQQVGKISKQAPFNKFNCRFYEGEFESIEAILFKSSKDKKSLFRQSLNGVLFLDEIDYLPAEVLDHLLKYIKEGLYYEASEDKYYSGNLILICASGKEVQNTVVELFVENIPMVIKIPSYNNHTLLERYEYIKYFLQREALTIDREIEVSSEVIQSLLMYHPQSNLKQLKNDIKLGCARAFIKNINFPHKSVSVELQDMPPNVQEGFWKYPEYKSELNKIVPNYHTYIFGKEDLDITVNDLTNNEKSLYSLMYQRAERLGQDGLEQEEISDLLKEEIDRVFHSYHYYLDEEFVDKDQLSKIVDEKIISAVKEFLTKAAYRFNTTYPTSLYYGLALHIAMIVERQDDQSLLTADQMSDIMVRYEEEYEFTVKNITVIENAINYQLPVQEIVFTTIFLAQFTEKVTQEATPNILVIMHGNSTAHSIAEAVNTLVKLDNVYSYDIDLSKATDAAYAELKDQILSIDNGQGLVVIYDMGSVKIMCEMIAAQTNVELRLIQIPITLLVLELSRQASLETNLDALYHSVASEELEVLKTYVDIEHSRKKSALIVLCNTGEGAATTISSMLLKELSDDFAIIPLSYLDRSKLKDSINDIKRTYKIKAVIATNDPVLGYPHFTFEAIFNNKGSLLKMFNFKTLEINDLTPKEINQELKDHINSFDLDEEFESVVTVVDQLQLEFSLKSNEWVGLYLHLIVLIDRIKSQEPLVKNPKTKQIIDNHNYVFKKVLRMLQPLENKFNIIFTDDDISTITEVVLQ